LLTLYDQLDPAVGQILHVSGYVETFRNVPGCVSKSDPLDPAIEQNLSPCGGLTFDQDAPTYFAVDSTAVAWTFGPST